MYNVVLTGSSRGLGKAMANEFLKRGHTVVIHSKNNKDLNITYNIFKKKYNKRVHKLQYDLANDISCADLVIDSITNCFDKDIDIWINNAGVNYYNTFDDLSFEQINQMLCVNLKSVVYMTKLLITLQKNTTIINVEGAGADGMSTPNYSVYGCTKSAISQFSKSLRIENNNVYTLSPGMIMTDMVIHQSEQMTPQMKFAFNTFCETPEYVAEIFVNKILENKKNEKNKDIFYLTPIKILSLLILKIFRPNRFF